MVGCSAVDTSQRGRSVSHMVGCIGQVCAVLSPLLSVPGLLLRHLPLGQPRLPGLLLPMPGLLLRGLLQRKASLAQQCLKRVLRHIGIRSTLQKRPPAQNISMSLAVGRKLKTV